MGTTSPMGQVSIVKASLGAIAIAAVLLVGAAPAGATGTPPSGCSMRTFAPGGYTVNNVAGSGVISLVWAGNCTWRVEAWEYLYRVDSAGRRTLVASGHRGPVSAGSVAQAQALYNPCHGGSSAKYQAYHLVRFTKSGQTARSVYSYSSTTTPCRRA